MKVRYGLLVVGALLAITGTVLVFALEKPDESMGAIEVQPFGGVLLASGLLLMGVVAISLMGSGGGGNSGPDSNSVKAIGGLIAVVAGIGAIALLAIVTLTRLDSTEESQAIALASSAFGVISAVVGAYLGIKVTADHSTEAKNAALAEQETEGVEQELQKVKNKVKEVVDPEKAVEVLEAGIRGDEEERHIADPPSGGGKQ